MNNLKYRILSGNEARHFNINESSGIISFSNVCKRNLDPSYNLTVAVSDGVFQNTAPVNIEMMNSNRHSPYFKQNLYEAELAENADAGTRVIRLAAIDPDDGRTAALTTPSSTNWQMTSSPSTAAARSSQRSRSTERTRPSGSLPLR